MNPLTMICTQQSASRWPAAQPAVRRATPRRVWQLTTPAAGVWQSPAALAVRAVETFALTATIAFFALALLSILDLS